MASSDVDSAESCERPSTNTSPGTKMIPPPTPSIPLDTPAANPIRIAATMSTADISEHQHRGRRDQQERERAGDEAHRDALLQCGAGHHAADRGDADEPPV